MLWRLRWPSSPPSGRAVGCQTEVWDWGFSNHWGPVCVLPEARMMVVTQLGGQVMMGGEQVVLPQLRQEEVGRRRRVMEGQDLDMLLLLLLLLEGRQQQ